jgi:ribosome-associated toxin RatA of RatAB toxin-antitoxin module
MNRAPISLVLWVAAAGVATTAARSAAAGEEDRLAEGEILILDKEVKGSSVPSVTVKAVVEQPPAKVWEVINDCTQYPKTMVRVKASELIKQEGNKFTCKVLIDTPFPLSDLSAITEAVHTTGPPVWSRRWKLIEGDYEHNEGSWEISVFRKDPKRSLVIYKVHAVPNIFVPGALQSYVQKKSLPGLIEKLRKVSAQ